MVPSIPSLPTLDWNTFSGNKTPGTPCLLSQPDVHLTTSGRASILLALEMLGIGAGDQVLVPTYHCPTMIAPVVVRKAQPLFYPLDEHGAPRLDWLTQLDTRSVRAILVAHFFGLPQHLAPIRRWCDQHGIQLIEDCAHALFGAVDGRPIGTWGDLAIGSLTKFLPVPEGGCLIRNITSAPLPELVAPGQTRQLKSAFDILHTSANHRRLKGFGGLIRGFHTFAGCFKAKDKPSSTSAASAQAIGPSDFDIRQSHVGLTYASLWIARNAPQQRIVASRRRNFQLFARTLGNVRGMKPLCVELPDDCAPYVFPLWVDQPDPGYAELRRLGFPVSRWDRLWPTVSRIDNDFGVRWSSHILQLACHQDLTQAELERMVATLKRVYPSNPAQP